MIAALVQSRSSRSPRCLVMLPTIVIMALPLFAQERDPTKGKEQEKTARITEEILVVAPAPKVAQTATVTTLDAARVERMKPLDLGQVMRLLPAAVVSYGQKNEATLLLRGIDAKRIVLLLDGIPVYEPYYGSFDLKTIPAAGLQSLQVTKGPSSVLYGPNTLGGIINAITARPGDAPLLALDVSIGQNRTWSLGLATSLRWKRLAFSGQGAYQDSGGFVYPDPALGRTHRVNSDYRRFILGTKLFYYPSERSEVLVSGDLYRSAYGMPAALSVSRPRYWRFPEWNRTSFSAGGFWSLGEGALLRFRAFTVNYDNVLDQFRDAAMTERQFRSTFDNTVAGAFALAEFTLSRRFTLKSSLSYQRDIARQQDDVGAAWLEYRQSTLSAAAEGRMSVTGGLAVIGGLSFDVLDKFTGPSTSKVNPLVGLSFTPLESTEIHLSWAKKSRFPSMRSLYSGTSGNPSLLSEDGYALELGASTSTPLSVSAAAFAYRFRNFIDSVVQPEGTRRYLNIGKAYVNGLEVQAQKNWERCSAGLSYTYLDHRNQSDDRPLDSLPHHTATAGLGARPLRRIRLDLTAVLASPSTWYDSSSRTVLNVPSYAQVDAMLSYEAGRFDVFLKAANLLNDYYATEPGYPWRGRYFEAGLRASVL